LEARLAPGRLMPTDRYWPDFGAEVLRLARLPGGTAGIGPDDPKQIARGVVKARRDRVPGWSDRAFEGGKDLLHFKRHVEDTWRELGALASEPDEAAGSGDGADQP
jgi:hypothetical protein